LHIFNCYTCTDGCPLHPHSEVCVSIIQHVIRNLQSVNGSSSNAGCSELLHVHQNRVICNGNSFLQDGRIPEFRGFSGPTWAHEFVTLSVSVDGAIYLAFELNVSVVLDHVFIGYLNCPTSRIGLPLVNVYWIDGNDYLNSPPLSGELIGTVPSSTHTQGGAHECRTLEVMAAVQHPLHAYSYVTVELLFSDDDDIVWAFLGEINFLIGRGAPDSIQVQLALTTTTFCSVYPQRFPWRKRLQQCKPTLKGFPLQCS